MLKKMKFLPIVSLSALLLSTTAFASEVTTSPFPVLGKAFIHGELVTYEIIDGYAIAQGDIILGRADELEDISGDNGNTTILNSNVIVDESLDLRWPNGVLPYVIDPELSEQMHARIFLALKHWNEETNGHIKIIPWSDETNYVRFNAKDSGCSAAVGMQVNSAQPQAINLSPSCSEGNIIHEIGHALGLWHEQSREDRNDWVEINEENIEEKYRSNFEQTLNDGHDIGPYDYGSIMHYPKDAFSREGALITIQPTALPDAEIGQRDGLSYNDIASIDIIYDYTHKVRYGERCLAVDDKDFKDHAERGRVYLRDCSESKSEQWLLTSSDNLISANGQCLSIDNDAPEAYLSNCRRKLWQSFKLADGHFGRLHVQFMPLISLLPCAAADGVTPTICNSDSEQQMLWSKGEVKAGDILNWDDIGVRRSHLSFLDQIFSLFSIANWDVDLNTSLKSLAADSSEDTSINNITAEFTVQSDWGSGYCVNLIINNNSTEPTTGWAVSFDTNGAEIQNSWNLKQVENGGTVAVTGSSHWNTVIYPGERSHSLGFCAKRTAEGSALPSIIHALGTFQ